MKHQLKIFAVAGLVVASVSVSQAQPYYVVGNYNGWVNPSATAMTDNGLVNGYEQYSYEITGQAPDSYPGGGGNGNGLKVTDGTWVNDWPGSNLQLMYDASGDATVYFYPGNIIDGWNPVQNRVGYADTGAAWEVTGDFTSPNWGDDANALMTTTGNGVYTVTYTIPTAGTYGFKFRTPGTWNDASIGADFGDNAANATVTTTTANQQILFQLDLPDGRWLAGNTVPPPVTNQVVFAVDMSSQIELGLFHPGYAVFVSGGFNGWPGTGVGALVLTNVPNYNGGANANIYYGTNTFIGEPGSSPTQYKFTDNDPALPSSDNGYEQVNNRTLTLLSANGTELLPVVTFGDLFASDILSVGTPVFFSVDMMSNGVYVTGTEGHQFDPSAGDNVYINGQFANWYDWESGSAPVPAPPEYQMIQQGSTTIYTNTIIIPAGTPVDYEYKYGMDPGALYGGPLDDEAGYAVNHVRVVRSTAFAVYTNATDTFGYQYSEPYFSSSSTGGGDLAIGAVSGGTVPVTWLGRPGAHLRVNSSLTGGSWQDLLATDGATWTTGYSSTNGFVSQTNYPASGGAFFRLVIP